MFTEPLANMVKAIHVVIAIFMAIGIFANKTYTILFHFICGLSILTHHALNNNKCVLALVEQKLTGKENYDDTLVASILNPIFTRSEFTWLVVILTLISAGKLWSRRDILVDALRLWFTGKNPNAPKWEE